MGLKNILTENMRIEVYDHIRQINCKSIIQEIDDDYIAIGLPMKNNESILLQEGTLYSFSLISSDALYLFRSQVLGDKPSGNVTLLLISWPQKTERIQRRDFFRIPCALDAQFMVITGQGFPPGDLSPEDLPLSETALAVNLSGGGLLLVSDSKLSVDSLLLLRLPLHTRDEIKTVLLKGRVIRTASFRLGKVRRYRYGIKFLDLKEKDREEIISYIFSTMRERLY